MRDDRRPGAEAADGGVGARRALPLPALAEPARPGTVRRSVLVSDQAALVTHGGRARLPARVSVRLHRAAVEPGARARSRSAGSATCSGRRGATSGSAARCNDTLAVDPRRPSTPTASSPTGRASRGYVSLTAWVVQFLVEAKAAGFPVDDALLDRAHRGRSSSRCAPTTAASSTARRSRSGPGRWRRSPRPGKFNPAYAAELARRAQFLDLEGVAQVLQSFAKAGDTGVARGRRAGAGPLGRPGLPPLPGEGDLRRPSEEGLGAQRPDPARRRRAPWPR